MCGIAGTFEGSSDLNEMVRRLKHRGPDGDGVISTGCAKLGHTRLAIVDVAGGRQPLQSDDAWIAFNGEIYNFAELRMKYLNGRSFATRSDTETILRLYLEFGPKSVELLDGMFAFAIVLPDELFIARDPLGIKPLYYGKKDGHIHFASEIKALAVSTDEIIEFPAGHWFHSRKGWQQYYSVEGSVQEELRRVENEEAALQAIRASMREAVRKRLMADVPLGVSLSGGLDSSIVSLIAHQDTSGLHSFVVGMEGSEDLDASRLVARLLGTRHHEFVYSEEDMLETLPEVIYYLESFDPALVRSAVPNFMLARMASDYVKVMLTGEGADELYAGYSYLSRYDTADILQKELIYITNALHNTNLQRGDRMSMAHGLEARVPFLDVDSVALALSLPPEWKLQGKGRPGKALLRRSFQGLLPDEIVFRPKMKFSKGAGSSDILSQLAEQKISTEHFCRERERLQSEWDYTLPNKEALFYYEILRRDYQDEWILPSMGRSRSI